MDDFCILDKKKQTTTEVHNLQVLVFSVYCKHASDILLIQLS